MSVAQQDGPVHHVTHSGELVGGNDGRDTALGRFVYGVGDGCSIVMHVIIDQNDVAVRVKSGAPSARPRVRRQESRAVAVLDGASVHAAEAGEALE